tara:strand:- start:56 stop:349 length:294 start_codon:yes stop_codon:yes gene_type:complete
MKEKYLFFQNAANDCMIYPLKNLKSVEAASTALNFTFDTIAGEDILQVTCAADEHRSLVDLATFLGGPVHNDGVYVIADDVNGVYAVSGFTAVGAAG